MDLDANQLKDLARRDNLAAVVQLIEHYYARIYAFLRRRAGNDADAADLTQRTFGRVQQSLSSFAGRSSVASWIHGVAHHTYLDWRRAERRPEPQSDEWWQACPAPGLAPDEAVARADLAGRLYACVDRLEPEQRDAVHLHYYQGLTLQEAADALDVSASTVKYRLRGALDRLQRLLAEGRDPTRPTSPLRV
jgi:RNA polymerase sigma-70 factor (ECF subfamily)